MSARIQDFIHFIEEGRGAKAMRIALALLGFIALAVTYDLFCFKNFSTEEAMDSAQLARNISEGKGYTTDYIRANSITTLQRGANRKIIAIQKKLSDGKLTAPERAMLENQISEWKKIAVLKTAHPDLANAPAYPLLLAGLMKIAPIKYEIPKKAFLVYTPEVWIAALNQFLFFLSVLILFNLAQQLFDHSVAMLSAGLFAATELFWRFSVSGLSTMLLVLIFLCLSWSLLKFLRANENLSGRKIVFWGIAVGVFTGIGCLTRYAFGWMLFPIIIFLLVSGKLHRVKTCLLAIAAFFLVISPWLVRNHSLSGNLFGIAGYAVCENTSAFPDERLERSLDGGSVFAKVSPTDYFHKFIANIRELIENKIPRLGGSWLMLFFLVGLLTRMPTSVQSRLRLFIVFSLIFMAVVQVLGRTHLSDDSPRINSENFLILFSPIIFVFAAAYYFELFRKIVFPEVLVSYAATVLFCVIVSAPLIFALLPPSGFPLAYPPYHPPIIQENANWMRKNELIMSDVPWAVAWYGRRDSISLSLNYPTDFLRVNDDLRTVAALYLTPKTTDGRFLSQLIKDRQGWGRVVLEILSKGEVPNGFPLKKARAEFLPDHIFLTDWKRWSAKPE